MGISNGKCVTSGVGPNCSHSEKGDGEKYDCLVRERFRCLGVLNRCIGNAVLANQVAYFDYTGPVKDPQYESTLNQYHQDQKAYLRWLYQGDPSLNSWGFYYDDGQGNVMKYARERMSAIVSCFKSVQCNWSDCYCSETKCPGPCLGTAALDFTKKDPVKDKPQTPTGTDPNAGPDPTNTLAVTDSKYGLPIPILYGRQMVAGNIIWLSELRQRKTYSFSGSVSVPTPTATVDIAIGLCEGPIEDIGRIWYDDVLVYDNRANVSGGTLQDAATFGIDPSQPANTALTRTQLLLFKGDEEQAPYIDGVGYRGLAYLIIQNFNLTKLNAIPQFRVEVFTRADRTAPVFREVNLPNPTGVGSNYLSGVNPDFAAADYDNGILYLGANGSPSNHNRTGIRVVDMETLAESDQVDPEITIPLSNDIVLKQSFVADDNKTFLFAKGSFDSLSVIDIAQQSVIASVSGVSKVSCGFATSTANAAKDKVERLVTIINDADISYWWMPVTGGELTLSKAVSTAFVGKPTKIVRLDRTLFPESGRPTYISEQLYVCAPEASQPALTVYTNVLSRTGSIASFAPSAPTVLGTIPAATWGGLTTGVSVFDVFPLPGAESILILIRAAAQAYAIKYNVTGQLVEWVTAIPSLPLYRSTFANYNGFGWKFVGSDGFGYALDFDTGGVLREFTVPVIPAGPQFYNPVDGSVTYCVSVGNATMRKTFIGRATAQPQALSDVFSDMFSRAGVPYANTSDVSDILIDGYAINKDSALRAAVEQVRTYYPVEVAEIGGALTATKRATGTPVLLNSDMFAGAIDNKTGVEITENDRVSQLEFLTIGYQRSDQSYALAHTSLRKPMFMTSDVFPQDSGTQTYEFPFVLSEAKATAICERLLMEDDLRTNTATIVVGNAHVALTPGTVIQAAFDGLSFTGLISSVVEEPNNRMQLTLSKVDPSVYDDDASLAPVTDGTIDFPDVPITTTTGRTVITLPVPLPKGSTFDNMINSINPILVAVRPTNKPFSKIDGYVDFGGTKTKFGTFTAQPVLGALRRRPLSRSSIFTLDTESDLVIFFRDQPTFTAATKEQLFANPKRNLLIVGNEYIQFCDFSIDPDGKTYHFTNLLRGLYGTDYAAHRHKINEMCLPWDDAVIQVINQRTLDFDDAYYNVALVEPPSTSLIWNKVQTTYYGGKSWATQICSRYGSVAGASFKVNSRSAIDYDLASQYDTLNEQAIHNYAFPSSATMALLLQPFDEDSLRLALDGKLTNYAVIGYAGLHARTGEIKPGIRDFTDPLRPYDQSDTVTSLFAADIAVGGIDAIRAPCDVAVLFNNHFKTPFTGVTDTNKSHGFYVVFRFDGDAKNAYPYAVGVL